jgi:hypothetical protein
MRFIERVDLDCEKWDALVESNPSASFFSYSWYLDALAEHWCIYVDDAYSKGVALPYVKRMGIEVLYVPVFSRYISVHGALTSAEVDAIRHRFRVIEFATNGLLFPEDSKRRFQCIDADEDRVVSSQGKRSLKKAQKEGVSVTRHADYTIVMKAIREELDGKFDGVNTQQLTRLDHLFSAAKDKGLVFVFEVSDGDQSGGIICLADIEKMLYVKGACPLELKRKGGMYAALNEAILYAKKQGLNFDFGGSNVEGVSRFNHNLGGKDCEYHYFENKNVPWWFSLGRKFKKRIKG